MPNPKRQELHGRQPDARPASALRASQEELRLLVGAVKDYAIFMLDPQGRVASWNAGAQLIKGYRVEEILGESFERFYPSGDVAAGAPRQHLEDARRCGTYRETGERVRKDGSRFWADVVITALHDDEGKLRGFAKVTRDITAQRAQSQALAKSEEAARRLAATLEARVQERTAQLAEANLEMQAFNYTVSHDLRAPLRGVRGFAQVLLEDFSAGLGEEGREYCRRIAAAGARMEQLVEDLLAYGRLTRQELSLKAVELEPLVAEVLQQFPGADVRIEGPLPTVKGHWPMLSQVVQNVVGNALKFVAPGAKATVRIRGERDERCARLYVEDDGIGIAPEHRERIFRVFERLHGDEQYPGTGIGLAIVRRAMERMGGRADVRPRAGGGSSFLIELPAA